MTDMTPAEIFAAIKDGSLSQVAFEEILAAPAKNDPFEDDDEPEVLPTRSRKRALDEDDFVMEEEEDEEEMQEEEEDFFVPSPPKAKAAKKAAVQMTLGGKSASSMTKAQKNARLRPLIVGLKAAIKTKKFYGGWAARAYDCAAEGSLSEAEYAAIFGGQGTVVPSKAKKSTIETKNFSREEVGEIFGSVFDKLSTQTYSMPRKGRFEKQRKLGKADLKVKSLTTAFNAKTGSLKAKFSVKNENADDDEYGSYGGLSIFSLY